ncbi:U2 snRNP-associated SURP motif-containing protein [Triticum urartu]|uniref:U2 snRNP-associated SURP motif-containing protein n=1 Tax=Triticum urartu TaxID=4572 RepID=M7YT60_TRIUA|nr:U2 snRNP-associated SURP motif-containing protein [Triticum urartu]
MAMGGGVAGATTLTSSEHSLEKNGRLADPKIWPPSKRTPTPTVNAEILNKHLCNWPSLTRVYGRAHASGFGRAAGRRRSASGAYPPTSTPTGGFAPEPPFLAGPSLPGSFPLLADPRAAGPRCSPAAVEKRPSFLPAKRRHFHCSKLGAESIQEIHPSRFLLLCPELRMSSKKVPFNRHKENEEARKKREEDEAARVYAEFVESFKGESTSGSKFVRGGVIDPNAKLRADSEVSVSIMMDLCTISFIAPINQEAAIFTRSAMTGGKSKDGWSVPKKGSRYVPSFLPPSFGKEPDKKKEDERPKEKEKGKPRAIDKFMEELKFEQELRERRNQERDGRHGDTSTSSSHFDELPDEFDPSGRIPGSFDDGDPQTTNLYVGNLSPQVDENFLLRTFGRFGPIASVKIMWPRTEEERRRQRNCGFVAFMNRAEGQAAKDEMQVTKLLNAGVIVYDYELKIGWGKSVALPSQALPAPPPGHMAIRNKEGGTVIISGPGGPPVASVTRQTSELVLTPNVPDIVVAPPDDSHLRHVIDTMALHVLDGGCAFEQAIMERGRGNSLFNFLFDLKSQEHTYYVWRLYSFAQGDTLQRWRTEPFIMITGSARWVPPALPSSRSPNHEKESTFAAGRSRRAEVERTLTDSQRDEFEDMLRALTLERSQIKEAMGFALDNADAAGELKIMNSFWLIDSISCVLLFFLNVSVTLRETFYSSQQFPRSVNSLIIIVEVLAESLTLKETSIPTKVARLMLVSDILHNSSAPVKNASAFRTKFEAAIPDVMESFNDLYRSITGRITAEALKERVLKVLQVWADWFLFSDAYLNGLKATFLRPGNSGVTPFHSLCGDAPEIEKKTSSEDGTNGFRLDEDGALATGKAAATKELLGLPLAELERRCRHNGLSLCGGKEMMVARLLSLEEAEKERVYQKDVDMKYGQGEPHRTGREDIGLNARSASRPGEASKWNREDDGSSDEDRKDGQGLGLSYSSGSDIAGDPGKADATEISTDHTIHHPDTIVDEEHRQKLRQIEIGVMQYRESLEEKGLWNMEELERKREYHWTGKKGMMMHAILPRSGLTAQVRAVVLQRNHHWIETESTIAAETDCMVMMLGETEHAKKVQAERRMITMIEAEKEKRTGERGGD